MATKFNILKNIHTSQNWFYFLLFFTFDFTFQNFQNFELLRLFKTPQTPCWYTVWMRRNKKDYVLSLIHIQSMGSIMEKQPSNHETITQGDLPFFFFCQLVFVCLCVPSWMSSRRESPSPQRPDPLRCQNHCHPDLAAPSALHLPPSPCCINPGGRSGGRPGGGDAGDHLGINCVTRSN